MEYLHLVATDTYGRKNAVESFSIALNAVKGKNCMSLPSLSTITQALPHWMQNLIPGHSSTSGNEKTISESIEEKIPNTSELPDAYNTQETTAVDPTEVVQKIQDNPDGICEEILLLIVENNAILTQKAHDTQAEIDSSHNKKEALSKLMNELTSASQQSSDGSVDCSKQAIQDHVRHIQNLHISIPTLSGKIKREDLSNTIKALEFERSQLAEEISLKGQMFQHVVTMQNTVYQLAKSLMDPIRQAISKIFK